MVNTNGTHPAGPPIGFDPDSWIEPSDVFPGEVVVSRYEECNEKYMQATQYRPALPRPIWQWNLQVKRLDARYQLLDGSQADVIRYGGYDLERYNTKTGDINPVNVRSNKEAMIGNAWKKVFGEIERIENGVAIPDLIVGKKAMFELFPAKRMGKNVAKNVLLPQIILPPDYTFTGEVQVFMQKEVRTEDGATEGTGTAATTQEAPMEFAAAVDALVGLLDGANKGTIGSLIPSLPASVRTGQVLQGLIDGTLIDSLAAEGRIAVASDGAISVAVTA